MSTILIVALVMVAIAELGDKTQMLTLVLAARHGARRVLFGVGLAIMALQLIAVVSGGLVSALVPQAVMAWVTGLLFIAFGIWTLLPGRAASEDLERGAGRPSARGPVLATAAAFFVAELGDKTQIMTMAIAADPGAALRSLGAVAQGMKVPSAGPSTLVAVWVGSTLGMLLVNGAAAIVGTTVGSRLPATLIKRVSGVIFILFGVAAIIAALG